MHIYFLLALNGAVGMRKCSHLVDKSNTLYSRIFRNERKIKLLHESLRDYPFHLENGFVEWYLRYQILALYP